MSRLDDSQQAGPGPRRSMAEPLEDGPPRPERRQRRRRRRGSWLERNAMSVIVIAALAGVVVVGFGLMQLVTRPDQTANTPSATAVTDASTLARGDAPAAATAAPATNVSPPPASQPGPREIVFSTKVLEANYTVQQGDSLAAIADKLGTTVERIQAINKLADPRVLNIGQKLVIPAPL